MGIYARNPNIVCVVCGKPIYRRPNEIKRNKGNVFCSISCCGKHNRIETPCVVCGKLIMAHFHKKTCSRSCANVHRAGIKYKMNRPRDKVIDQRSLKLRLLRLRGEKCERCGYSKIQILQVHHKDRNHDNNNLDNLALICPNCHYEDHFLEKSWLNGYNLHH